MGQKPAVDISLTYNGWIFGRFPQSTCKLYDHDHDDSDDDHDDDDQVSLCFALENIRNLF